MEILKSQILKYCSSDFFIRENQRCYTVEFLEQRGDDLVFLRQTEGSKNKTEFIYDKNLSSKKAGQTTYKPSSYFLQFPIAVGNEWKGSYVIESRAGNLRNRTRSSEVRNFGDLIIKAGSFKAYEIQAFNQLSTATNPATEKYYYCPEIAAICKYESREFDLYYEVVSVTKKDSRN